MRILQFLLILGSLAISQTAAAQHLALEVLDKAIANGQATPDSVGLLLAQSADAWERLPGSAPIWVLKANQPRSDGTPRPPLASVSLRRSNEQVYYDVIYKVREHACLAEVRAGLRRRAKLQAEAATCVECEAERLVGYGYSATFINQKAKFAAGRTDYPYVMVLRRTGAAVTEPTNDSAETISSSGEPKRAH